jgi:prepilin-type processing-associated H-X9-DG protein
VASTNLPPNNIVHDLDKCRVTASTPTATADWCEERGYGFNSVHSGGLNMALADGSVLFINEAIDYRTWNLLGDKADGLPFGAF